MNDAGTHGPNTDLERSSAQAGADEERLQALVEDYLAQLHAGNSPDPAEYVLANPALAAKLESRLGVANLLHRSGRPAPDWEASADRLQFPANLGRYRIDGRLGSGASADVFRAHDPKFQRMVALKVLRRFAPAGSDALERFQRDARIAAQLRHPNIVPLHDAGEMGGLRYIDMELIRGETLEQRIHSSQGWFGSDREAAELVYKLATALEYAHREGIVHRDVKPSNILIDERGEPQLTDFGLARIGNDQTLTAHGQIIGTPVYMSPEQAAGRGHQADHRSDVYSLGVILFRLLTGRLPFDQTDSIATLLAEIIAEPPPRPRAINPSVPRDLETICLKAMQKAPGDRFATAQSFADELRRWLNNEPLVIRPPTLYEQARRWARRHRSVARITTGAAALLVLMAALSGWAVWDQREQRHAADLREAAQRQQADTARQLERVETEKRVELEAWSLLVQARQRLVVPTVGRRSETEDLLRKAADLRGRLLATDAIERLNLEMRSLYAASLGVPELAIKDCGDDLLPGVYYAAWRAAIHPDGESMIVGTHLGPVRWVRGQALAVPHGLDSEKPRPRLTYSPDGKYLAFAPGGGGLQIWDEKATGIIIDLKSPRGLEILDCGFGRDSLWACRADGVVTSWSLPGFANEVERKLETGPITAAKFNRDATLLAVGDADGRVRWRRPGEGEAKSLRELATGKFSVDALAWSPDNSLIAVGTRNGIVQLWNQDGPLRHEFYTAAAGVSAVHFNRDGQWLLAGGRAGGMQMWNVNTGEQLLDGPHIPFNFSRDGNRFASGSVEKVAFGELAAPYVVQPFSGHRTFIAKAVWSRDSRYLATLDSRFELRVWDVEHGLSVRTFEMSSPGSYTAASAGIALSSDGAHIAFAGAGKDSTVEVFDVRTGETVARSKLAVGFTRLVHDGSKFVLVREERMMNKETRTVACTFTVDNFALNWREVRAPQADEERHHDSALTPDGRFYLWAGPRVPPNRMRVEVYEVATGRRVRQILCPHANELQSWGGRISPDGRRVWVQNDSAGGWLLYELSNDEPPTLVVAPPQSSPDLKWVASSGFAEAVLGKTPALSLRTGPNQPPWLQFTNGDFDGMDSACFSPNSRFFAWYSPSHTITVVDLPALRVQVEDFERSLGSR